MKTLKKDEIGQQAALLQALASQEALEIIQKIIQSIRQKQQTGMEIANATGIDLLTVTNTASRLVKSGILLNGSEDTFVLNPNMPDLAQDVLLSLWPDWFEQ